MKKKTTTMTDENSLLQCLAAICCFCTLQCQPSRSCPHTALLARVRASTRTHAHTHTHTHMHTRTHTRTHAHTHARTRRLLHSHVSAWLESCIVVGKTVIFMYTSIHNHAQEYLFEHTRTHTYTPHTTDAPSGRVCTTSIPSVNRMCHALADTHNPSACIQKTQPASHKCTPLVQRVVVSADIDA